MNAAELLLGPDALARHGARSALVCAGENVSYAQMAARTARSSGALAALGVRAGDRVLFLMRDTPEFAAAWLGAVRMGAVAVALNNKLSEMDYRHILADSAARLVVVEDVFAQARPDLNDELARAGRVAIAGAATPGIPSWRERVGAASDGPCFDAAPETPAFYLYSSGTTGRPKGIVHAHRSFAVVGAALR